jgi:NAD(P)-dependent dehydrogenase (short-subunit alcohol dehydrogenase family)
MNQISDVADPARIPRYADLMRLDGRGFVVLGAGQGIGEQSAHALAQSGAELLCVDFDAARAEAVAAATGGRPCVADITRSEEVQRVFDTARQQFGDRFEGVIDVVGMPLTGTLAAMDPLQWQRQFDLVIGHAWLALQHAVPLLQARGGGSMVFIGSMAGAVPRGGALLAYGAAKAALHHLVKSAAQEFGGDGIRINAVAPGLTRTPRLHEANPEAFWQAQSARIPLGRPALPSDIAASVLFLSTPLARHITGNVLLVDGGASLGASAGLGIASSGPQAS